MALGAGPVTRPHSPPVAGTFVSFATFGAIFGVWQVLLTDLTAGLGISCGALGGAMPRR